MMGASLPSGMRRGKFELLGITGARCPYLFEGTGSAYSRHVDPAASLEGRGSAIRSDVRAPDALLAGAAHRRRSVTCATSPPLVRARSAPGAQA